MGNINGDQKMRKQSMEQKMKRMKEEYNKINVPSAAKALRERKTKRERKKESKAIDGSVWQHF